MLDHLLQMLPGILKALVLLAVCLLGTKILMAASGRVLDKSKLDKSLHSIILSTIKVLLVFRRRRIPVEPEHPGQLLPRRDAADVQALQDP